MSMSMNTHLLAFINSPAQMFVVAVLVLILFGAKKLPVFARSLGRSLGEFKRAKDDFDRELHSAVNETDTKPTPAIEPAKQVEVAATAPAAQSVPVPVGSAKAD